MAAVIRAADFTVARFADIMGKIERYLFAVDNSFEPESSFDAANCIAAEVEHIAAREFAIMYIPEAASNSTFMGSTGAEVKSIEAAAILVAWHSDTILVASK
jgi:hypothetical protein